ncbi:hypothetical protein BAUCODRAFT_39662 [Baudoinia panamericana UAMH 10762]|uniref:Uncharacterized protein n=1 Tax=Baudoinia panamericana (strain UAMH 10762) TaxID=717646 RepID=M2MXU6_BAUPA|nr:uncharacterized protein BAUCODRAFT_39662 [Baudoinia panamericana UAMH 10762]EMC91479.1 hypothetical protein BAUCODRAFT_39662 [Baudoinia panamericana UAMH 10762]
MSFDRLHKRLETPDFRTFKPASSSSDLANMDCTVTVFDIKQHIPEDGISLFDLRAYFDEARLPSNSKAAEQFVRLVKQVAFCKDGKYHLKYAAQRSACGSQNKAHSQHETNREDSAQPPTKPSAGHDHHGTESPKPSTESTAVDSYLKFCDIRAHIPPNGTTLSDLRASFSEQELPAASQTSTRFAALVGQIAILRNGKYYVRNPFGPDIPEVQIQKQSQFSNEIPAKSEVTEEQTHMATIGPAQKASSSVEIAVESVNGAAIESEKLFDDDTLSALDDRGAKACSVTCKGLEAQVTNPGINTATDDPSKKFTPQPLRAAKRSASVTCDSTPSKKARFEELASQKTKLREELAAQRKRKLEQQTALEEQRRLRAEEERLREEAELREIAMLQAQLDEESEDLAHLEQLTAEEKAAMDEAKAARALIECELDAA